MRIATRTLLLLASLAATRAALAAQEDIDCENAMDQTTMNICAAREYEAADAALNEAYRELAGRLDQEKKLLTAAQRAWIAFRDAECAFRASEVEGGSMHPMVVSGCLTELTEARTADLQSMLECPEGDVACVAPGEE